MIVALAGCKREPMNEADARQLVEDLIIQADAGNYDNLKNFYSPAFNQSEPVEVKKEKLMHLQKVLGPVTGMEFISATHVAEFGQPRKLVLEYRVLHTKINTIEKFSVVEEEGGYRVSSHSVQSENL
jgi:hypothetical protein